MLIESLLTLVLRLLVIIFNPISIMTIPENVYAVLTTFTTCIADGIAILAAYTHMGYLLGLLAVVVAVDVAVMAYHVFFWVLEKIPFLNIKR